MKNEKMLERCLELSQLLDDECKKTFVFCRKTKTDFPYDLGGKLAQLITDLEADVASDCARSSGRSSQLAAAKRVISSAKKTGKAFGSGAWMVEDRQYLCDGYHGFRLNNPLPLEPLAAGTEPMDLNQVFKLLPTDRTPIDLPTPSALKAHIKFEKANRKAVTKEKGIIGWDFGPGLPLVDAELLLNVLELLPNCTATGRKERDPLYFESEAGDAILMPRRKA